jgi:hypothetical protein
MSLSISEEHLRDASAVSVWGIWTDIEKAFVRFSSDEGVRSELLEVAKCVRAELESRGLPIGRCSVLNALDDASTDSPDVVKQVVPYRTGDTDQDEWDGPAEIREASVEELAFMATWFDADNPDVKSSYKLPHHRRDGTISFRGLAAAMGALLGARGGVDIPDDERRDVYEHLARHYRDDFDREPPEFVSQSSDQNDADADFVEKSDMKGGHLRSELIEIDERLWVPIDRLASLKLK